MSILQKERKCPSCLGKAILTKDKSGYHCAECNQTFESDFIDWWFCVGHEKEARVPSTCGTTGKEQTIIRAEENATWQQENAEGLRV